MQHTTSPVARIELFHVAIPLPAPFYPAWIPGMPQTENRFTLIRVTTDDVAFARALLNPQIGRWLVEHPDRSVRLTGDALVTWQERRLTAPSIEPALDYLCDLADHLPD